MFSFIFYKSIDSIKIRSQFLERCIKVGFDQIKIIVYTTSNARPGTSSALPCRNRVFELSENYLLIQFQKAKQAHSRCVFNLGSSRRSSSAS